MLTTAACAACAGAYARLVQLQKNAPADDLSRNSTSEPASQQLNSTAAGPILSLGVRKRTTSTSSRGGSSAGTSDRNAPLPDLEGGRRSGKAERGVRTIPGSGCSSSGGLSKTYLRLAALNGREWPWGIMGAVGSIGHGVITPAFALMLSLMIGTFVLGEADRMEEQASIYAIILAFIGVWSICMITAQMWAFAVMGVRLATRLRSLLMMSLLRQEVG